MPSAYSDSFGLHWSPWHRPGRGPESVPHLRYLSVSRHFDTQMPFKRPLVGIPSVVCAKYVTWQLSKLSLREALPTGSTSQVTSVFRKKMWWIWSKFNRKWRELNRWSNDLLNYEKHFRGKKTKPTGQFLQMAYPADINSAKTAAKTSASSTTASSSTTTASTISSSTLKNTTVEDEKPTWISKKKNKKKQKWQQQNLPVRFNWSTNAFVELFS